MSERSRRVKAYYEQTLFVNCEMAGSAKQMNLEGWDEWLILLITISC